MALPGGLVTDIAVRARPRSPAIVSGLEKPHDVFGSFLWIPSQLFLETRRCECRGGGREVSQVIFCLYIDLKCAHFRVAAAEALGLMGRHDSQHLPEATGAP